MRKLLAVLSTMLVLCLSSAFCQGQTDAFVIAMDPSDELVLNPYTATDSDSIIIMQNLHEGLFSYNARTSLPDEAIASSYEVSDDGLTWTFHLRETRFSDGTRITAQTFIDSWNYLIKGPLSSNLDFVRRNSDSSLCLDAPDPYTLVVQLNHAVQYLPNLLCQPCLAAIKDTSSYSGAYKLVSNSSTQLELSVNPYYWDEVKSTNIRILLGSDYDQMFHDNEIQWAMYSVSDASEQMVVSRLYATTFFYFSASDGAYANDQVRQALTSLIPWDVIRGIQDSLISSESLVPESGAYATLDSDIVGLLHDAGYTYSETGFNLPVIRMAVPRGSQNAQSAELIATLWARAFGVTVTLDTVPLTVYTANPEENPYDFCLITWIGDYFDPMAFLGLFASDSSYNLANYSNSEYDAILESASYADEVTRMALLLDAEQLLLDSGVVIPLSTAFATNFVNSNVTGWYSNSLDIHPFKYLEKN